MRSDMVLHAAPPAERDRLSGPLATALSGAAQVEGLAADKVTLAAAQDQTRWPGGAGVITASTPVVVVEEAAAAGGRFTSSWRGSDAR